MYKLLLVFLLMPLVIFASDEKGKYTKTKKFNKEYSVNDNNTVKISNKYGKIDIATWNENRVVIDVLVTTNGNDEEKVAKRLEQIHVEFNQGSDNVSAKTIIEKNSKNWSFWGKKNNVNIEINYTIKMPVTNNVDLSNDYGAINLDKLSGSSKIDCDYGKIQIGDLMNSNNNINLDYSKNSTIEFMKSGDINVDYSGLNVEQSENITLNADYSQMTFGKTGSVEYDCDYGSLNIDDSGKLKGNSDYMHTTISTLNGSATVDLDYGSFKVGTLGSAFNNVNVQSSYAHIKFGVPSSTSFGLNAILNYVSFKGKDGFSFSKEIEKGKSKTYEGSFNGSNSGNQITLKSSFGSVSFTNK